MSEQYLLEMKGVNKSFPGVKALQNVSFQLKAGEVHALLGENGAGKSTLIKVLGGIYHAEEGDIYIEGKKVEINGVTDARAAGISIVHQELVLVPYMTVAENIFLGRELGTSMNVNHQKMKEEAQALLDAYEMNIQADTLVEKLTIAQQQMVEIVKAISFNSKILVLDEPTSSISDKEVGFLFNTIRTLTKKGVGIIYISHKMSELDEICDRVTVMRDGQTVGTRVVKETTTDALIAMMVGRELTNYYTRDFLEPGEVVLKCEHISDGKMAKDASFELRKGEIIGFAGLVGAGRSETMKAIFGLAPKMTGDVYVKGQKVKISSPIEALKHGIALVPESRKTEGLYKVQSVKFNSTIQVLGQFIKNLRVNSKKEEEITQKYIDLMATKTPSQEQVIGNLSGGNQQKVMIGRWLATDPEILILDEPTRGVATMRDNKKPHDVCRRQRLSGRLFRLCR
ncbi:MAG: sugar ABC transporter ATP-binding protein [Muricoprocola sp.]